MASCGEDGAESGAPKGDLGRVRLINVLAHTSTDLLA